MIERLLLSPDALRRWTSSSRLPELCLALQAQQQETWELLRSGYQSLDGVRTREFRFDDGVVRVQFNPGRLTSSAAKVDEKSIKERPCFLCTANLPPMQRGLAYGSEYLVLCNPFPIFPQHLTIPRIDHVPQQIEGNFEVMLAMARDLAPGFTVFYNGPRCGASAPDHMHFQAGTAGFMPLDEEYDTLCTRYGRVIVSGKATSVIAVDGPWRRFLALEGNEPGTLARTAGHFMAVLREGTGEAEEPMVNVLASYHADAWRLLIYPRVKHRPSFFYETGEKRILISPAAVDLGGVCITPLEEDFGKINRALIAQMFDEVMMGSDAFQRHADRMRGAADINTTGTSRLSP